MLTPIADLVGEIPLGQPERVIQYAEVELDRLAEEPDLILEQVILFYKGIAHNQLNEPDSAQAQLNELLQIGIAYENSNEFENALYAYDQIQQLSLILDNQPIQAVAYQVIGNMNTELGAFDEAIIAYSEALATYEALDDRRAMAVTINNMGDVYKYLQDYREALAMFRQSLVLQEEVGDSIGVAWTLGDIADVYRGMGAYEEALSYFNQSIARKEEYGDHMGLAWTLNDLGIFHRDIEAYEEAMAAFEKAQAIYEVHEDRVGIANALFNRAGVYFLQGRLEEALKVTESVWVMADSIGALLLVRNVHQQRATILEQQGLFDDALQAYKSYKLINDSLFNSESQGIISELQQQYRTKEQQQQIELLESRRTQQRLLMMGLTGGIVSLGIILLLGIYQMRERRRSIAEIQLAKQETELKAAELERANNHKSRFLASISHEFRTPLTLTFGPLDDALGGRFASLEDARPYFETARRNGSRLLHLINQLLDLSKLDADALLLHLHTHDIVDHLRQLANLFVPLAERSSIQFLTNLPQRACLYVYDADKIEKVVVNLLSNAFKFTPAGGTIELNIWINEGRGLSISVVDTGAGIEEEHLNHLFDRFYQADNSSTRTHEGTGIGLALVKELVGLHGGAIEVESSPRSGSTFLVHLPERENMEGAARPVKQSDRNTFGTEILQGGTTEHLEKKSWDSGSEAHPSFSPQHVDKLIPSTGFNREVVLVIEDNPDMRAYIRGHLSPLFTIVEAENGKVGLEKALEIVPDLILADVMMPEMDGLDVCSAVKTDERTSHIPVILLTARGRVEYRIAGFESGADAYMAKPFNAEELLVRVRTIIAERRKLRERFGNWQSGVDPLTESDGQLEDVFDEAPVVMLPHRERAFLEKVEGLVEKNVGNSQFGVDQLAEELMMSRRQVQRKLRALTNTSPADMIRQVRLSEAAELLGEGELSVKEVCFAVGFKSRSSFSRAFRLAYGKAPNVYRNPAVQNE
ncbi:MAG: tetratricopeptide repeat protein [Rhodothermaceae bacterium]|nr:tetratricopeptide repeat protein [Rhodothermaceae bacterium]